MIAPQTNKCKKRRVANGAYSFPKIMRLSTLFLSCAVMTIVAVFALVYNNDLIDDDNGKDHRSSRLISEATPEIPFENKESPELVATNTTTIIEDPFCYGKNGKVQKDANGQKWFNGAPIYDEQPGDAFLNGEKISKPKIFMYRSERLIADLLRHPPGMPIPAAPNYAIDWDQDFADSLLHHIEILPTDSQEVRQLKRDVIDTKKEIVAMIKDGGSFSEVIAATQKEANKLAGTRNEMLRIYNEMKRDGASAQELKDHLDAANILLERQGSMPLPISRKLLLLLEENE